MAGGKNGVLRDDVCGSMVMKTSMYSTRYTNRVDVFVVMLGRVLNKLMMLKG